MIESAFAELYEAQMQLVRRSFQGLSRDWPAEHRAKELAAILGDLVKLQEPVRKIYDSAWAKLFQDQIEDEQSYGVVLMRILNSLAGDFDNIEKFLDMLDKAGRLVPRGEFQEANKQIHQMRDDVARKWPRFDPQKAEEARAAINRGEFYTATEALDELRGSDS